MKADKQIKDKHQNFEFLKSHQILQIKEIRQRSLEILHSLKLFDQLMKIHHKYDLCKIFYKRHGKEK